MRYKILEHPADLKIRAFGRSKEELFLNMAQGMQDALQPNFQFFPPQSRRSGIPQITPTADSAKGGNAGRDPANGGTISNFQTKRNIKIKSNNLETLLVDFLSEILYLTQVNKEIYDKIKFLKFSDNEIEVEISGKAVESFGEDIKGATYHDLEIKRNPDKTWQATVLFDI